MAAKSKPAFLKGKSSAKKSSKWIQGAVKEPGALHKELGVPQGKTIPRATLLAALAKAKKDGDTQLMQRINFALNVGKSKK